MGQLNQADRDVLADRARSASTERATAGATRSRLRSVVRGTVTITLVIGVTADAMLTALRWLDTPAPTPVPTFQAIVPIGLPAATMLLAAAAASRRRRIAVAAAVLLVVHVWLVAPWWITGDQVVAGGTADENLVVMASNQQFGFADLDAVAAEIRDRDVDVLVLVEATSATSNAAQAAGIDRLLPHRTGRAGLGASGGFIYSKYPLTTEGVPRLPDLRDELPAAVVRAPRGDVLVVGVHPVSPVPGDVATWHRELAVLSAWTDEASREQPLVLAGDFNATIDHPVFRRFGDAGMGDAQREIGRGRRRTWPQARGGPPAVVDLDHVLIRGLGVAGFDRIPMPGSDHYAVSATLLAPGT